MTGVPFISINHVADFFVENYSGALLSTIEERCWLAENSECMKISAVIRDELLEIRDGIGNNKAPCILIMSFELEVKSILDMLSYSRHGSSRGWCCNLGLLHVQSRRSLIDPIHMSF